MKHINKKSSEKRIEMMNTYGVISRCRHASTNHGQTGTVHEATNAAIELNVVQIKLGCSNLQNRTFEAKLAGNFELKNLVGIFLRKVAKGVDFFLTESGVIVEVHLGDMVRMEARKFGKNSLNVLQIFNEQMAKVS